MVVGGEDPRFLARRLVILASEDVGLATPEDYTVANAAMKPVNLWVEPGMSVPSRPCDCISCLLSKEQHRGASLLGGQSCYPKRPGAACSALVA